MKVLYQFDKYLNTTMNWAERWIRFTQANEKIISAPIIIHNQYYLEDYQFWQSPYQWYLPENEWGINPFLKIATLLSEKSGWYKKFLLKKLMREQPDLVHVQFGNVAAHYLPVFKKANTPLVATFNGYDYEAVLRKRPTYLSKYHALFEYADCITTGGSIGAKKLEALGCSQEKIKIVRLAVDPAQIPFLARKKEVGNLDLLQVATFTRKKGHLTTLKALKVAQKEYPSIRLTMLGEPADADLVEELEQYVVKHNLNGVKFDFRVLPYEALIDYFKDFHVFIHPSETPPSGDCEGTPVTMMDAQLSGLPVLSTFHADIPEVVKDGVSGKLVPEKDFEKLGSAIIQYATMDGQEYAAYQKNARLHIEETFDVRQSARDLQEIYQQVIMERKK
jgi:colanic acid/amylovoran biosynthesis glycosyltransferase